MKKYRLIQEIEGFTKGLEFDEMISEDNLLIIDGVKRKVKNEVIEEIINNHLLYFVNNKDYYILFEKGSFLSFEKACEKAEELGYKKLGEFNEADGNILELRGDDNYFFPSVYNTQELINIGYTRVKTGDKEAIESLTEKYNNLEKLVKELLIDKTKD